VLTEGLRRVRARMVRRMLRGRMLEANLITPTGLALSVATEFLENTDPVGPQDCELRAFPRPVPRLRKISPGFRSAFLPVRRQTGRWMRSF
jgi:hypothetical protein